MRVTWYCGMKNIVSEYLIEWKSLNTKYNYSRKCFQLEIPLLVLNCRYTHILQFINFIFLSNILPILWNTRVKEKYDFHWIMAYESSRENSIKIRVWCLNRLLKNFSCYFWQKRLLGSMQPTTPYLIYQKKFSLFMLYMVLPCSLPFSLHLSTNVFFFFIVWPCLVLPLNINVCQTK